MPQLQLDLRVSKTRPSGLHEFHSGLESLESARKQPWMKSDLGPPCLDVCDQRQSLGKCFFRRLKGRTGRMMGLSINKGSSDDWKAFHDDDKECLRSS